jgi:hypothetical protein
MSESRKGSPFFGADRRRRGERRSWPRYLTGDLAVRIIWEHGGQRGETRGALCDISQGGVSLLTHKAPPRGVKLVVQLEGHPSTPPLAGSVSHIRKTRLLGSGPVLVGLRLGSECSYEFFSAVLRRD